MDGIEKLGSLPQRSPVLPLKLDEISKQLSIHILSKVLVVCPNLITLDVTIVEHSLITISLIHNQVDILLYFQEISKDRDAFFRLMSDITKELISDDECKVENSRSSLSIYRNFHTTCSRQERLEHSKSLRKELISRKFSAREELISHDFSGGRGEIWSASH
jgi:hypothetical protein